MHWKNIHTIVLAALMLALFGCSGGSGDDPVAPGLDSPTAHNASSAQTHLWGLYDVYIDIENRDVVATLNRSAMFTANVVQFVNMDPANLGFVINSTPMSAKWVDVDIDVSITHPFAMMPQYRGYDVRGVFIGEASGSMDYGIGLDYGLHGIDQTMLDDTDLTDYPGDIPGGGPDGYTRWHNPSEFTSPGVFGYTQGVIASPGYAGGATLNPYKYFADGLGPNDDAFEFLATTEDHGIFSDGETNTRNYYLRFPHTVGVRFSYAILADWSGEADQFHPSNAVEALAVSVECDDGIFYVDGAHNGGHLTMDFSVFDWNSELSPDGWMEDYGIQIESTVLDHVYALDNMEMVPVGGTDTYSTYHVDILADEVDGIEGQEFWLVVEYPGYDYSNPSGVPNHAESETLAAFFRHDIEVFSTNPPVITGIEDDILGNGAYKNPVGFGYTAVTYDVLFTDEDPFDTHEITWFITEDEVEPSLADKVTMPVDWSAYEPGPYDIHVFVDDGTMEMHGGPFPITNNTPPQIISGIDGNPDPLIVNSETYSVTADDPEVPPQTLSYTWTLTDVSTNEPVPGYDEVPGNGDGTIDIDWEAMGAQHDEDYELDCIVHDGLVGVYADTLEINSTLNLYHGIFDDDDGGMILQYSYYSNADRKWHYRSDDGIWEESMGVPGYFNRYTRARLRTPTFSVPSGITGVRLEVRQWAGTGDTGDRCYLQYSINGGSYWYTQTYWHMVVHGSSNYDISETFTLSNNMIGRPSATVGFYFYSDFDTVYMGPGWKLKEVRVYIIP